MLMRHIVTCELCGSSKFFHITSQTILLLKEVIDHKIGVWIFCKDFSETFVYPIRTVCNMIKNLY